MRVHELAKELGLGSNDLLDRLATLGVTHKNHVSALEPDIVARVRAVSAPVIPASATMIAPAPAPAPTPEAAAPEAVSEPVAPAPETRGNVITLKGPIIVRELAVHLGVKPNQLIAELMRLNILATINEPIEIKDAARIAEKHGFVVEREKKEAPKPPPKKKPEPPPKPTEPEGAKEIIRPPVVTVLGHVDHGKTSLLDRIRNTAVARGEAGGITQHIGASTVKVGEKSITFLDTPGHAAFTAMRARGANMTDIAIIVVDAQDGLMPQTHEAIKHALAAKVPVMVAVNKIDLPTANLDKVRQQLASINLTPEDWGGTTIVRPVSALTGEGVPELLEYVLLQAEMLELKVDPSLPAKGFVIEAQLEAGMGPTANLLILEGTLHVGDTVLCGPHWGKIRALIDDHGKKLKSAGPSTPVKCMGLSGVPEAGAAFEVHASEKQARATAEQRQADNKMAALTTPKRASLTNLFEKLKEDEKLDLKVILKTDVQGSLEAIDHSLRQIKSDKVSLTPIMSGVGSITSNDVLLASASDAIVLGFHVPVEEGAAKLAKQQGVEIHLHSIIYELIDKVREAMSGMLTPILREKVTGHAEVRQVFTISKSGVIAGCMCTGGRITPRLKARVKREGAVLFEGSIASLRRFQNDVSEVKESQECGIRLDNFGAFAEGDVIEFFDVERISQTL
jgi:translation initiation factor IF-2